MLDYILAYLYLFIVFGRNKKQGNNNGEILSYSRVTPTSIDACTV